MVELVCLFVRWHQQHPASLVWVSPWKMETHNNQKIRWIYFTSGWDNLWFLQHPIEDLGIERLAGWEWQEPEIIIYINEYHFYDYFFIKRFSLWVKLQTSSHYKLQSINQHNQSVPPSPPPAHPHLVRLEPSVEEHRDHRHRDHGLRSGQGHHQCPILTQSAYSLIFFCHPLKVVDWQSSVFNIK